MPKRLGWRRRRLAREPSETFFVTLALIVLATLYRMGVLVQGLLEPYGFDRGWSSAESGELPLLASFALALFGVALIQSALLFDRRLRTRSSLVLCAVNLTFMLLLGSMLSIHAQFGEDLTAHRRSGARSFANLEAELVGVWETTAFEGEGGASGFPARTLRFDPGSRVRLLGGMSPEIEYVWWEPLPTAVFRADRFVFAGRCGLWRCVEGPRDELDPPIRFEWSTNVEPPAILLFAQVQNPATRSPPEPIDFWFADADLPAGTELVFRALRIVGDPRPVTSMRLRRVENPGTGWDLGAELAPMEPSRLW